MSATLSQPPPSSTAPAAPAFAAPAQIDASCRLPLLLLFLSGAVWLLIGSAFALIASLKFHAPGFLADSAWLSYGRVRPAGANCFLYGFALQAGLGVALWVLARLGRTTMAGPGLAAWGAVCWNVGVTAGVLGILAGRSTGFETLEMPLYAARLLLLGYLMMALWAVLTFHRRRERQSYVSQWFLLAGLFWFPWIYSTATLVLFDFGARGMAQAVLAWWYSNNLLVVWLGLVGLGAVFYFLGKLTGRELHSRYLALLTFWMLILVGSWGGIPASAPVPAWMPVASGVATVMGLVTIVAVGLNVWGTLRGGNPGPLDAAATQQTAAGPRAVPGSQAGGGEPGTARGPALRFIGFGAGAFVIAGLLRTASALPGVGQLTQFTWFTPALGLLHSYGFFAMVVFGAVYYLAPRLVGLAFPFPRLLRAHLWIAAAGVLLFVVPLAVGGIIQGLRLQQADVPFTDIARGTLPFLRASTMGDLLMALGHLLFLLNVGALVVRFCRARALSVWAEATTELNPAEARP
jgi:cytochrome c oxidase cbb3-type subunit I